MTQPNLDALAKMGPFQWGGDYEGDWIEGRNLDRVDRDDVIAALDEWVELRASAANRAREASALRDELHAMGVRLGAEQSKVAELRAYRERTEAGLTKLTALLEAVFDKDVNSPVDDVLYKMDVELDLYRESVRDPAPKEASDGN